MSGRRGAIGKREGKRGVRWHYVVDLDAREDGKRRQLFKGGFLTEREATDALHKLVGDVARGEHVDSTRLTVSRFLVDQWLPAQHGRELRASTLASYESVCKTHLIPQLGTIQLQRLTPAQINVLYAKLRQPRDGRKHGLSPRSIRYAHTILRRALEDARRWGLVVRNVADLADPPSPKATKPPTPTTWTADEVRQFLAAARDDRLYAAFLVAATTGMRRGEVLGLHWRDVDLDGAALHVVRTLVLVENKIQWSTPKTRAGLRRVSLDAATVDALRAHRKRQAEERLLFGAAYQDEDLVFAGIAGEPIHPTWFVDQFRQIVKHAGVPVIRWHDLRHTFATIALSQGVHPRVVQERLGHSDVSVTLGTYSHVSPDLHEQAAGLVASLFTTT